MTRTSVQNVLIHPGFAYRLKVSVGDKPAGTFVIAKSVTESSAQFFGGLTITTEQADSILEPAPALRK